MRKGLGGRTRGLLGMKASRQDEIHPSPLLYPSAICLVFL